MPVLVLIQITCQELSCHDTILCIRDLRVDGVAVGKHLFVDCVCENVVFGGEIESREMDCEGDVNGRVCDDWRMGVDDSERGCVGMRERMLRRFRVRIRTRRSSRGAFSRRDRERLMCHMIHHHLQSLGFIYLLKSCEMSEKSEKS